MENNYTVTVVPLGVIQEKHAAEWEEQDRRLATGRQKALDYFSARIIRGLEERGRIMADADAWDNYPDFDVWKAVWALEKLRDAYKELGYNVTYSTFSKSYHVKGRLIISARK